MDPWWLLIALKEGHLMTQVSLPEDTLVSKFYWLTETPYSVLSTNQSYVTWGQGLFATLIWMEYNFIVEWELYWIHCHLFFLSHQEH